MTLRRRLLMHAGLMLTGIAALSIIAITAVAGLRDDYGVALRANQQLRDLYSIGVHLAAARSALNESRGESATFRELQQAKGLFDLSAAELAPLPESKYLQRQIAYALEDPTRAERSIDAAYTSLADASAAVRKTITTAQAAGDRRHHQTLLAITITALATLAAMGMLLLRQYRTITQPLDALRAAVGQLAGGKFSTRAHLRGDAEFAALAEHFNRMADELAAMHARLQQRVATKSRELSQAQRLASIGYLAAGVAHEINNPLGIIAGYGQRTLRRIDGALVDAEKIKQTLGVICDEAFRCKKITDRLLMLARPTATQRAAVHLPQLIEQTIASLATLRPLEGRRIESRADGEQLIVIADADALRQVVLNLLINAVEATTPNSGIIRIDTTRTAGAVELKVSDNGRGIAADRVNQIFEPFVTDQRDRPGTGLGLAIALSIISDHGGTIHAGSDGVDRGSCFTVSLPAEQV